MSKIEVTEISIYPVKSTTRVVLEESIVEYIGLKNDRILAVLNKNNEVITARENPKLLTIAAQIEGSTLKLNSAGKGEIALALNANLAEAPIEVSLFKNAVNAKVVDAAINDWISEVIEEEARIVRLDENKLRQMKAKYNANPDDFIAFSDAAPLHLISEASVQDLNAQLEKPVTTTNFRPNVVVKGCSAYEEDSWKWIKIGACLFQVAVKTGRCPLTTIDPKTAQRDKNQEPLRTLSATRKENNKVNFGIYLIPRKLGTIKLNDKLEIHNEKF